MKKILLFFILTFVICVSFLYGGLRFLSRDVFIQTPIGDSTVPEPSVPTSIQEYFATKTPVTILVAGYGGGNHDGAYLTDTLIAVRIDPKSKKIFTVSIPRDIWTKIPTNGNDGSYWKVNAAYALGRDDRSYPNKFPEYKGEGGAALLTQDTVSKIIGQPIPYFVGLNFSGFVRSIDTLGGVDIDVNPAFVDTQYPIEGKEAELCDHALEEIPQLDKLAATTSAELVWPCRYETLNFSKGVQHMDGTTALKYVRSRHSAQDGSDFGRSKRQQKLALAVKQKIFSVGFLPKIVPFLATLGGDVRTNLSPDDVKTFLGFADELNAYTIESLALSDKNYLRQTISDNGQNILASIDGIDNWQSVHTWLSNTFAGLPIPVIPVVQIRNGTRTPGLGQHAYKKLEDRRFQLLPPTNAPDRTIPATSITLYSAEIAAEHIQALQKEFKAQLTVNKESTPSGYNILVVLGQDYVATITPP